MLRSRIIPTLLIDQGNLVKTVKFRDPSYIGDPLNAVKIFNEKEVDELLVADISASTRGENPDYSLIRRLAAECRMPLCYAGGVRTAEQVQEIIGLGVEKVGISAGALEDKCLIKEASERVGSQSVVAILDVTREEGSADFLLAPKSSCMTKRTSLEEHMVACQDSGVGEFVVNDIDREGTMKGYSFELIDKVQKISSVPLTVVGGAGSFEDLEALVKNFAPVGVGVGSLFVFKGKYRAVLISYPKPSAKARILGEDKPSSIVTRS